MAKTIDPALAARLREESEQTRQAAYPAGVRPTRPNRSKVYSIRLSEEEQARVEQVADAKHLPASTLVRSWILDRLNQEKTARPASQMPQGARGWPCGWAFAHPPAFGPLRGVS